MSFCDRRRPASQLAKQDAASAPAARLVIVICR
jgi:hypothetical protein